MTPKSYTEVKKFEFGKNSLTLDMAGHTFDIELTAEVIAEAIHTVQTEMGITGTTAAEAATTIQGSLGMVKGAWENLLTGLTDPTQDLNALTQNLFDSLVLKI